MNELLQTGQHPDADQLSAFAEQALPAHERQQILLHLAVCGDCRAVVSLAMPLVDELPDVRPEPVRRPWFSGWNLAWPFAVAFACLALIVVQLRRGGGSTVPPQQIADSHRPEPPRAVEAPPARPSDVRAQKADAPASVGEDQGRATSAAPSAEPTAKAKRRSQDHTQDEALSDLPMQGRNVQALPVLPQAAPRASGVVLGNASGQGLAQQSQIPGGGIKQRQALGGAASNGPPIMGTTAQRGTYAPIQPAPLAAWPAPPPLPRPAAVNLAGSGAPAASATPATSGAPAGVAVAGATTVTVAASDALAAEPEANASTAFIADTLLDAAAKTPKILPHPLPGGLPAVSIVNRDRTMLALDSSNALFYSGDAGTHWKPVRATWPGKAVKVALAVAPAAVMQAPVFAEKKVAPAQNQVQPGAVAAGAPMNPQSSPGGATLRGYVLDATGASISGASVTVTNASTGAAVTVTTDATGRYVAGGLATGGYRLDAAAVGFEKQEMTVTLAPSQTATADMTLRVGQATETVSVSSAPAAIETENRPLTRGISKSARAATQPAPAVFAITTDAGERWVSADGQSWRRE